MITDLFIQALKEDIVPWQPMYRLNPLRPADEFISAPYQHYNALTKKPYRSVNTLLLEMSKIKHAYEHSFWLTFKQAGDLALTILPGSKHTPVFYRNYLYFKRCENKKVKIDEKEYWELKRDGDNTVSRIPYLKKWAVFNIAQTEGDYEMPEATEEECKRRGSNETCEQILGAYQHIPEILHGRPAYQPDHDVIFMPDESEYENQDAYYHTLFHEVGHSTGHRTRLNRPGIVDFDYFGSPQYAKEELVGEIFASFLSAHTNTLAPVVENSKAYIQNWIQKLQQDPQMIYWASIEAQKAFDFVLTEQKELVLQS